MVDIAGSIALLWHYTSSEVRFLDLVFQSGASGGGPGNPCYGGPARAGQPPPLRKTKSKNRTSLS